MKNLDFAATTPTQPAMKLKFSQASPKNVQ